MPQLGYSMMEAKVKNALARLFNDGGPGKECQW